MDVTPGKPLGANTSEGVLANFFNSLLSKKTGAGGGVSPGGGPGSLPPGPGGRSGGSPQPDDCKYMNYLLWIHTTFIVEYLVRYYYSQLPSFVNISLPRNGG